MTVEDKIKNINLCKIMFQNVEERYNVCVCEDKSHTYHIIRTMDDNTVEELTYGINTDYTRVYRDKYRYEKNNSSLSLEPKKQLDKLIIVTKNSLRDKCKIETEYIIYDTIRCIKTKLIKNGVNSIGDLVLWEYDVIITIEPFLISIFLYDGSKDAYVQKETIENIRISDAVFYKKEDGIKIEYLLGYVKRYESGFYTLINNDNTIESKLCSHSNIIDNEIELRYSHNKLSGYGRINTFKIYKNGKKLSDEQITGIVKLTNSEKYVIIKKANKNGIMSVHGEILIIPDYGEIRLLSEDMVVCVNGALDVTLEKHKIIDVYDLKERKYIVKRVSSIQHIFDELPLYIVKFEDDTYKYMYYGKYIEDNLSNIHKYFKVYYNKMYYTTYKVKVNEISSVEVIINDKLQRISKESYAALDNIGWEEMRFE